MARELPRWHNVGVSPPDSLKNIGWQKGDKPPFQYLNWFMNRSYKALEELQISKVEKMELDVFREELLNQISNRVLVFDSASSMRANVALTAGAVVETLGFYVTGDGGGATYIIVNGVTNPDGYFDLRMSNGLVARLLPNAMNTVNIRQLGARPQDGEIKYDNKQYVDAYLARLDSVTDRSLRLKLYIPSGIWNFSPTVVQNQRGFSIMGDAAIPHTTNSVQGTIINALNDNQSMIWDLGRADRVVYNYEIGNLTFSACHYVRTANNYAATTNYTITSRAVWMCGLHYGTIHPITFTNIHGTALEITSIRDTVLERLTFRNISDFTKPVMRVAAITDTLPTTPVFRRLDNVNFKLLEFESVAGDLIQYDVSSGVQNLTIDTIHVWGVPYGTLIPITDASYNDLTSVKMSVIKVRGGISNLTISQINLHEFAMQVAVSDGVQYVYDTVIGTTSALHPVTMKVVSLNTNTLGKDYNIIRNFEGSPNSRSTFTFGEVVDVNATFKGIYNVTQFPTIYVNNSISKTFGGRDLLRGSWIPARDAFRRIYVGASSFAGMLQRAEGSESPDQLIVRPLQWLAAANADVFYLKNNKYSDLRMRFKLAEGETVGFRIYGQNEETAAKVVTITGTGDWTISTILAATDNVFNESGTLAIAMQLERVLDVDLFQWVNMPISPII